MALKNSERWLKPCIITNTQISQLCTTVCFLIWPDTEVLLVTQSYTRPHLTLKRLL